MDTTTGAYICRQSKPPIINLRSPSTSYSFILATFITIPAILTITLTTSANAADGTKICNHSYQRLGLISVSIHPAPLSGSPPLTFGVAPSSAGKRWFSTKYWRRSSFSRHRARSQSLNCLSSWRGMSAMAKRRQYMFTDFGGRPWK